MISFGDSDGTVFRMERAWLKAFHWLGLRRMDQNFARKSPGDILSRSMAIEGAPPAQRLEFRVLALGGGIARSLNATQRAQNPLLTE